MKTLSGHTSSSSSVNDVFASGLSSLYDSRGIACVGGHEGQLTVRSGPVTSNEIIRALMAATIERAPTFLTVTVIAALAGAEASVKPAVSTARRGAFASTSLGGAAGAAVPAGDVVSAGCAVVSAVCAVVSAVCAVVSAACPSAAAASVVVVVVIAGAVAVVASAALAVVAALGVASAGAACAAICAARRLREIATSRPFPPARSGASELLCGGGAGGGGTTFGGGTGRYAPGAGAPGAFTSAPAIVEGGAEGAPCVPKLSTIDGAASCFTGDVGIGLSALSTANGPCGAFCFLGAHLFTGAGSQPNRAFTRAVPTRASAFLPKQKSRGSKVSMYDCSGPRRSARRSGKAEGLIEAGALHL